MCRRCRGWNQTGFPHCSAIAALHTVHGRAGHSRCEQATLIPILDTNMNGDIDIIYVGAMLVLLGIFLLRVEFCRLFWTRWTASMAPTMVLIFLLSSSFYPQSFILIIFSAPNAPPICNLLCNGSTSLFWLFVVMNVGIVVVGTSNRIDCIDAALLRKVEVTCPHYIVCVFENPILNTMFMHDTMQWYIFDDDCWRDFRADWITW